MKQKGPQKNKQGQKVEVEKVTTLIQDVIVKSMMNTFQSIQIPEIR